MQSQKTTAILLFAESAKVQASKKRLLEDADGNFRLFQKFNHQRLKTLKKSGFDYFHFDESDQEGNSFAQKIATATDKILRKGYERIIVIGSDAPDLRVRDLWYANRLLDDQDIVLGPDLRGGLYLIALKQQAFNRGSFQRLQWQSSALRSSFVAYAENSSCDVSWLRWKADFNKMAEVMHYWKVSNVLRKIIGRLFSSVYRLIGVLNTSPSLLLITEHSRRGPPNR